MADGKVEPAEQERVQYSARDFHYGKVLGMGSFSKVVLAVSKSSGEQFALKIMDKRHIIKERKVAYVKLERLLMDHLKDYPGIVRLHFTFQDQHSLYMGLECCPAGELFDQIKLRGKMEEPIARFYAAEIVSALQCIHEQGVIHRDLKPENIFLTSDGHLRIGDFGSAKCLRPLPNGAVPLPDSDNRSGSFVGTAEYVPPELLNNLPVTQEADLWALGCVLYQMLVGVSPFRGASEYLCFQKILSRSFDMPPEGQLSAAAKDIVNRLLESDPSKRLGAAAAGGFSWLKAHPFFDGVEWETLFTSQAPVPISRKPLSGYQPQPAGVALADEGAAEHAEGEEGEWGLAQLGGIFSQVSLGGQSAAGASHDISWGDEPQDVGEESGPGGVSAPLPDAPTKGRAGGRQPDGSGATLLTDDVAKDGTTPPDARTCGPLHAYGGGTLSGGLINGKAGGKAAAGVEQTKVPPWKRALHQGENVLAHATERKKLLFFGKSNVHVLLTDWPRLLRVPPSGKPKVLHEDPWDEKEVRVLETNEGGEKFALVVQRETFLLKDKTGGASHWISSLEIVASEDDVS